jgi:hypothetical protein
VVSLVCTMRLVCVDEMTQVKMKKRKTNSNYIDRGKTLAESNKRPNVVPTAVAAPCNNHFKSQYRLFKYKITVPPKENDAKNRDDTNYTLDAMMMRNELCVLMFQEDYLDGLISYNGPAEPVSVAKIQFCTNLDTDAVAGKRKKGAQIVKAGSPVCTVTFNNGSSKQFCTPVGGQLLELNTSLEVNCNATSSNSTTSVGTAPVESLNFQQLKAAYVAVIMPNTIVPTLDLHPTWESLIQHMQETAANANVCFAFQKGECKRGDKCKFIHKAAAAKTIALVNAMDEDNETVSNISEVNRKRPREATDNPNDDVDDEDD